jgi:hypothetical protein
MGQLAQLLMVAGISVAVLFLPQFLQPRSTATETNPATGNGLLSEGNLNYAVALVSLVGGGLMIYTLLHPKK